MYRRIHDTIVYADHVAWYYLNTQWHNEFLDTLLPFFRNQWFWTPLYLFLALHIPSRFGRKGLFWCLGFILAFAISDQVSAHFMKQFFHRLRPCNNPYLNSVIHLLVNCGSGLSFPSSHASNHFAIGTFSAMTLDKFAKWIWPVAIVWALLVCYSQVYVGVHYPLDVVVGGIVGTCVGIFTGLIFNRYLSLTGVNVKSTESSTTAN
jgi:membrane-associated phospholipid phosphatase